MHPWPWSFLGAPILDMWGGNDRRTLVRVALTNELYDEVMRRWRSREMRPYDIGPWHVEAQIEVVQDNLRSDGTTVITLMIPDAPIHTKETT